MAEENPTTEAASPAPKSLGNRLLNIGKGIVGIQPGQGMGSLVIGKGKMKLVIPMMVLVMLLFAAIFFLISGIAVYASRLGAVPGYAGGISSGTCPSTAGFMTSDNTFDDGTQLGVINVPEIAGAQLTETITSAVTTYCPPIVGSDHTEGGQAVSYGNLKAAIGGVAVPNNEKRFPLGRTVLDIPGIGLRVATDHGSAIIENNPTKGGDADIDLFVGWASPGSHSPCDKLSSRWVHSNTGSGGLISGVKVYVFPTAPKIENYPNQAACQAANQTAFTGANINGKKIVLDPGHYAGHNNEFVRSLDGVKNEGDHNFIMATKVKNILTAKGYNVILTHNTAGERPDHGTSDPEDLAPRVAIANSSGANLFVSLHSNSGSSGVMGIVYCTNPKSTPDPKGPLNLDSWDNCYNKNPLMMQSESAAQKVMQQIQATFNFNGSPQYIGAQAGMLHGLTMPGFVIEMFDHTSSSDTAKVDGKSDQLAQAIAQGIIDSTNGGQ